MCGSPDVPLESVAPRAGSSAVGGNLRSREGQNSRPPASAGPLRGAPPGLPPRRHWVSHVVSAVGARGEREGWLGVQVQGLPLYVVGEVLCWQARKEGVAAGRQHPARKVFHKRRQLDMEVVQHQVGVPATHQLRLDRVNSCAEHGHRARRSEGMRRDILRLDPIGGANPRCHLAEEVGHHGGG